MDVIRGGVTALGFSTFGSPIMTARADEGAPVPMALEMPDLEDRLSADEKARVAAKVAAQKAANGSSLMNRTQSYGDAIKKEKEKRKEMSNRSRTPWNCIDRSRTRRLSRSRPQFWSERVRMFAPDTNE